MDIRDKRTDWLAAKQRRLFTGLNDESEDFLEIDKIIFLFIQN
jgi:hypothetical protein